MTGKTLWIAAAAFLLFGLFVSPLLADDPETRPAEFAVLDRWLGDWDLVVNYSFGGPGNPQRHKATYRSSVRWSLNDRFLRCEAKGEGMDGDLKVAEEFMWIMTFDPQAKRYTSSVYWSNVVPGTTGSWGTAQGGVGTWQEKEQIMTIRSEDKETGIMTLSITQWSDKDNHRWVQSMTAKDGTVVAEMSGTGKRRK